MIPRMHNSCNAAAANLSYMSDRDRVQVRVRGAGKPHSPQDTFSRALQKTEDGKQATKTAKDKSKKTRFCKKHGKQKLNILVVEGSKATRRWVAGWVAS